MDEPFQTEKSLLLISQAFLAFREKESRARSTGGHVERVSHYAVAFGRAMLRPRKFSAKKPVEGCTIAT